MQRIIRKIKKLLAMAEGQANEHESAVAAKMAATLMEKYQLDHADVVEIELKDDAQVIQEDVITDHVKAVNWKAQIQMGVARAYFCETRYGRFGRKITIQFFGYKPDAECAAYTYQFLINEVERLVKRRRREGVIKTRIECGNYRMGAAQEIRATLEPKSSGTDLVVVKRDAIARKFGDFRYPNRKTNRAYDEEAYAVGRYDGKRIRVRPGVGGRVVKRLES